MILITMIVFVGVIVSVLLELLRHRWKGHTFWKVWKWVNELSFLIFLMIERTSVSVLTITSLYPILARNRLVI